MGQSLQLSVPKPSYLHTSIYLVYEMDQLEKKTMKGQMFLVCGEKESFYDKNSGQCSIVRKR